MVPRTRLRCALTLRRMIHLVAFILLACTSFTCLAAGILQAEQRPPRAQGQNLTPKDFLPPPPVHDSAPAVVNDLSAVPEVEFQRTPPHDLSVRKAKKNLVRMIARIKLLNRKNAPGFLLALRDTRPDLAGLPFIMGDACRLAADRASEFATAVDTVRASLGKDQGVPKCLGMLLTQRMRKIMQAGMTDLPTEASAKDFWQRFEKDCAAQDKAVGKKAHVDRDVVTVARIRALMQMLAPESSDMRVGLVRYLSDLSHPQATRALAQLAVFSREDEVRQEAIVALQLPRKGDYTDILSQALRYPWPAIARHAGEAIVKLDREDLIPRLVASLDEPDPRAPFIRQSHGKKSIAVRELVRLNHLRNCLLCHEPVDPGGLHLEALTPEVPVPGQPLPTLAQGYRSSDPELFVRVDVSYLRPDFSILQPVAQAKPWPRMQRFDFMVRTRTLTTKQANAFRKRLAASMARQPSPYRRVALVALRELTGRNAGPTADDWRRMLGQ